MVLVVEPLKWAEQVRPLLLTRICREMDTCVRRASIVGMPITNKIVYKMHRSYTIVLRKVPLLVRTMSHRTKG